MINKNQAFEISDLVPVIEEVVNSGGKFTLVINGKSMTPLIIENRDAAILCAADDIKRFDIILYRRSNGSYVLHRIVKIKNDVLYLCGDNQTEIEYPIYKDQVIAKACGIIRNGEELDLSGFKYKLYVFFWGRFINLRPQLRSLWYFMKKLVKSK